MHAVVYSIGGSDPEYQSLVNFSIATLRSTNEQTNVHVIVLCDDRHDVIGADQRIVLDHSTAYEASFRKTALFELVPHLHDYDAVLFLDADIVVTSSLQPLFDAIKADPHALHVVHEGMHDDIYHSHAPYSPEQLDHMARHDIQPFNAGQWGMVPTPEMHARFTELLHRIIDHGTRVCFWEQSHMNMLFNPRGWTTPSLNGAVHLYNSTTSDAPDVRRALVHCLGANLHWRTKLRIMRDVWARVMHVPKTYDSRTRMHEHIHVRRGEIVEIGVFKGDFSDYLLTAFDPARLYLIDPWDPKEDIVSGDQDGNDVQTFKASDLEQHVVSRFRHAPAVTIIKAYSHEHARVARHIRRLVDLVYVDGDHTYEGIKRDLEWARRHVKPGGWICGHDYGTNPDKCAFAYDYFGVQRAVNEFCTTYGYRIDALFRDGCQSFAIRV